MVFIESAIIVFAKSMCCVDVLFQSLLENCIVHGVWLSLNLKSSDYGVSVEQAETNFTIHPLFEVC